MSANLEYVTLEFRITPEDSAVLTEEAIARRLAERDRRVIQMARFASKLARVLLALAPIGVFVALYSLDAIWKAIFGPTWPGTMMQTAVVGFIAAFYWPLWWRYRNALGQRVDAYFLRRSKLYGRELLARVVRSAVSRNLKRREGLHRIRMGADGLTLHVPSGARTVHIPWQEITRIDHSTHFYKITTARTQRIGLRYLVAKHSSEMDSELYQAGLRLLLEKSPVALVAD